MGKPKTSVKEDAPKEAAPKEAVNIKDVMKSKAQPKKPKSSSKHVFFAIFTGIVAGVLFLVLRKDSDALLLSAEKAKERGDYESMFEDLRLAVDRDPTGMVAHVQTAFKCDFVRKAGAECPEWASPRVQYTAVLDQQATIPNPPKYFEYPIYALAHSNLANDYEQVGDYEPAKEHYTAAIAELNRRGDKSGFYWPYKGLATIYERTDAMDQSKQYFRLTAQMIKNDGMKLHANTLLPLVYVSQQDFDTRFKEYVSNVRKMKKSKSLSMPDPLAQLVTVPNFYAAFFGTNNKDLFIDLSQVITDAAPSLNFVSDTARNPPHKSPGEKINVGFSSLYFREHASAKMIVGVIEELSRQKFHVTILDIKDYEETEPKSDWLNARIRARADTYHEVWKTKGLEAIRREISDLRLDVLIFSEIGMDPVNYLLAFSRLAPVQIATHGHASTTGIASIDYFVSYKPFEPLNAQQHYSEKLVTFSDFSNYDKPRVPVNIPSRDELFALFGITERVTANTVVYVCHQTIFKLIPEFDKLFRDILLRNRNAILLLKEFRRHEITERFMSRIRVTLADVIDQVVMLTGHHVGSETNWFGMLQHADVVLDSYPFGGYTTSMEAWAVGSTPIVTLPHELMAGRCTAAFYKIMGIPDLIATDYDNYIDIAERLGKDEAFRKSVSDRIASRSHYLWNRKATVPEWEQFLEEAVHNKPITNLHQKRPTAPIYNTGSMLPKL